MRRITPVARVLVPLVTLFFPALGKAATLEPATLKAWDAYVESANIRMEQRLSPASAFLWLDEEPERRARIRAGEIVVSPVGLPNPKTVPSGLIHDWVGAAFIAGVTLHDVLGVVRDYAQYKDLYQPAVADSKVINTDETKDRFSMLLIHKSTFLKTALDVDYESQYIYLDDGRAYSLSRATRIQEVYEYGLSGQHILEEGEGKGIIWRLFNITRYAERDGGVYVELEAIGLSRDIPASLRFLVEPIVRRVSQASLSTSLRQTENAVHLRTEVVNKKTASVGSTDAITHGGTPPDSFNLVHSTR
jgi:hypothetical protein